MEHLLGHLSHYLAGTAACRLIQSSAWMIPAFQTVHILAISVIFSSAILLNLRVLGLVERDAPLAQAANRFLPALWTTVPLAVATGVLMIVGEPRRALMNESFHLKMLLLLIALAATALTRRTVRAGGGGRALAVLSMLVWAGVIFAGRWIAYSQPG